MKQHPLEQTHLCDGQKFRIKTLFFPYPMSANDRTFHGLHFDTLFERQRSPQVNTMQFW
jgi:hypothetical protein